MAEKILSAPITRVGESVSDLFSDDGKGTKDNPYIIATVDDVWSLAWTLHDGWWWTNYYFKFTCPASEGSFDLGTAYNYYNNACPFYGFAQMTEGSVAVKFSDSNFYVQAIKGDITYCRNVISGLDNGDKFKIGSSTSDLVEYEYLGNSKLLKRTSDGKVFTNLITSNDSFSLSDLVNADTISQLHSQTITNNTIDLTQITADTGAAFLDASGNRIAILSADGTLTTSVDVSNLTVNVGTGREYTLSSQFTKLKVGDTTVELSASGDYKVNGYKISSGTLSSLKITNSQDSFEYNGTVYQVLDKNIFALDTASDSSRNTLHAYNNSAPATANLLSLSNSDKFVSVTVYGKNNLLEGASISAANNVLDFSNSNSLFWTSIDKLQFYQDGSKCITNSSEYPTFKLSGGKVVGIKNGLVKTVNVYDSDSIRPYSMSSSKVQATIYGLPSGATLDDVTIDGTTIKLSMAAIATKSSITMNSSTYKFGFADDVKLTAGSWTVSNGTAKYSPGSADAYVLSSDKKKITYNADSGSVIITGLNTSATLSDISIDSTTKVVTVSAAAVGERDITVTGDYTLALASGIAAPTTSGKTWSVSNGTAKYLSESTSAGYTVSSDGKTISYTANSPAQTLAEVSGLKSSVTMSDFSLSGSVITLKESALDGKNVTVTGDYTLALAKGIAEPDLELPDWSVSEGTANFYSSSITPGYVLDDDQKTVEYVAAESPRLLATITGLKSSATDSDFSLYSDVITLKASALDKQNIKLTGEDFTLALESGIDEPNFKLPSWEVAGGTAKFYSSSMTAGYTLSEDAKSVDYVNSSSARLLATITGLKSSATENDFSLYGDVITLKASALNKKDVTLAGDDFTLALADDVTEPTHTDTTWNISGGTATYVSNSSTAGYTLSADKKSVDYTTKTTKKTLATLTGLNANATAYDFSLNGNVITLKAAALGQKDVTVTGNYILDLSKDVAAPTYSNAAWSVTNGTAKYVSASNTAGYTLSEDKQTLNYIKKSSSSKTLATITGLDSSATTSDFSVNGNVITLKASALNGTTVTATGDYTLALAKDVATPVSSKASWQVENGMAVYTSTSSTPGYTVSSNGKTVNFTDGTSVAVLATITGLKSTATTSDFSVNGKVITLKASALDGKNVSVSGDYTLALDSNVTSPTTSSKKWSISNGTAKYLSESTSAGYTLSSDGKTVEYKNLADSQVFATITGLKSSATSSDISVKGKTITLKASALGDHSVSISGGDYTLALADDVSAPKHSGTSWNVSKGTAICTSDSNTAGYTLSADKKSVSYTAASKNMTVASITGLKSSATTSDFSVSGNTVTLKASALAEKSVSISGDYNLALASGVKKSSTTAEKISVSGKTATGTSEKVTEGYAVSSDKKSVSYVSATSGGETLFTVTGLKKNTSASNLSLSGTTVTLKSGALKKTGAIEISEGYTLALASGVKKSETKAGAWNISGTVATYTTQSVSKGYAIAGDGRVVNYVKASGGSMPVILRGVKRDSDADSLTLKGKTVTIDSSIIGSKGVSVVGGGYNYQLTDSGKLINISTSAQFKGSSESDTLIGGESKDTLRGYAGNDYISGGTGDDYLSGGSGADTVIGGKGIDYLSGDAGADYLSGGAGNDYLSGGSGKDVLIGGAGSDYLKGDAGNDHLSGNAGADVLEGGAGNDALYGGAGKDILYGGKGADTLNGGTGNDILYGEEGNDYLNGGKGNDTLRGGSGKDTLTGGAGNDIFVYSSGAGKDVITDYTAGKDKIQIDFGSISKTKVSGQNVIFTIGSGTLTVKDGKGKKITIIDENGSETTKTYSTSNSSSLFAEDNFATADDLSAIVKNDLSATDYNIEQKNLETLTVKNNLITFADK